MKNNKKIIIGIIALIIIAAVSTMFIYYSKQRPAQISLKCPESYATGDEYTASLQSYVKQEESNNPNITMQELVEKRYELLVINHCTKTLQYLQNSLPLGTAVTKANIIQNEVNNVMSEISSPTP